MHGLQSAPPSAEENVPNHAVFSNVCNVMPDANKDTSTYAGGEESGVVQGEGECHTPTPQVKDHPRWLAKYSYLNQHGELSYVDLHENNEYYYYPEFCGHPVGGNNHQLSGDPAGEAADHVADYVSGEPVEGPGSGGEWS